MQPENIDKVLTMYNFFYKLLILLAISIFLIACDNQKRQEVTQGEKLFKQDKIGFVQAPGCILCHSLDKGIQTAGPSLYAIGQRAANTQSNMNARQYIYDSIVNPNAYVVYGYRHDLMYPHYANDLEADEIKALVDFLVELK
jgi:cytochrome c553